MYISVLSFVRLFYKFFGHFLSLVHPIPGVLMARILEWFAIPSSSGHFVLILHDVSMVIFKVLQARL